jgi:GT2 family glycosyltransferase
MLCAPRQVSCLTGAALIMSRTIFDNLNGFDPMLATYLQDVDFSLRVLNSGFKLVLEPRALLFHMESVSVKPELVKENVGRVRGNEYNYFNERWGSMIHTDEWMNLLIERSDESLRSLKV